MTTSVIHQSSFNFNELEGAVSYILQLFGPLSVEALNAFVFQYAINNEIKNVKEEYAGKVLLPWMRRQQAIFSVGGLYASNPMLPVNRKMETSFWIMLEFLDEINMSYIWQSPFPGQVSFVRRNCIYEIICCDGAGSMEIGSAYEQEMARLQRERIVDTQHKEYKNSHVEHRYILAFSSLEDAKTARFMLKEPTLICIVNYSSGRKKAPELRFLSPNEIAGM